MIAVATRRSRARQPDEHYSLGEAWDQARSDYSAARDSRFQRRRKGLAASGSGADYHYRSEADYLRLMEKARDMDRNDVIVGQLIDRAITNWVQGGFNLDPATGSPQLDEELYRRWDQWSSTPELCDLAGEHSFRRMELKVPRAVVVDGDHFALPTREGPLELIEAHRCRTPANTKQNCVHGVLLDAFRRRLEYWFTRDEIDPQKPVTRVGDMLRRPARDEEGNRAVFHLYNPDRITQTRGVTELRRLFDVAGMFEDLNFAKLVQAQVTSCFAIFKYRSEVMPPVKGGSDQTGEQTFETLADGSERVLEGLGPGMRINAGPGEKFEGFSPNVPNAEFFAHVRLILTLIGINLGMPLVLTTMDASETNFSGYRGAVDQARMAFRRRQEWLRDSFHAPVYRWKVRQWLAEDPLLARLAAAAGVDPFGHRWNLPSWPYIEPLTDNAAGLLRLRNGLTSPRRFHAEGGNDSSEIGRETIEDNAVNIIAAKIKADEINRQFNDGQPVHWRELLFLPTPDGVKITLPAPPDANQASRETAGAGRGGRDAD